ncbi:olfactory receptor 4-like-domain-containing protein [Haematococcus lacustris]
MVRSCLAEESVISPHFKQLRAHKSAPEVGLLIGRRAVGSRDLLLGVVPTPQQDGRSALQISSAGSAAGKQAKKDAAAGGGLKAQLQAGWVADHAMQVQRMLPGGLCLLGCYVFAPESSLQLLGGSLCQTLAAIRDVTPATPLGDADLLLLSVDSVQHARQVLRSLPPGATSLAGAKAVDLKDGPCAAHLVQLRCRWHLDLHLPCPASSSTLQQQLASLVEQAVQQLRTSLVATPCSRLPPGDTPLQEALPSLAASSGSTGTPSAPLSSPPGRMPHASLQLVSLPGADLWDDQGGVLGTAGGAAGGGGAGVGASGECRVQGRGQLAGCLQGLVLAHKRDPWSRVVSDVLVDLEASLTVRMELMVEDALSQEAAEQEAEQGSGQASGQLASKQPLLVEGGLAKPLSLRLPRRVCLPCQVRGLSSPCACTLCYHDIFWQYTQLSGTYTRCGTCVLQAWLVMDIWRVEYTMRKQ